jgi:hypothetical protein
MTRLIWVFPVIGPPVLINPAQIRQAVPAVEGGGRRLVLCFTRTDNLLVLDPDGKLLHLLTDGVPEPPKPPEAS